MKLLNLSFWVLLIGFSSHVQAVVVDDLFTIELEVADQTPSVRQKAFQKAFENIIIKVSGSRDPLNDALFKRPLRNTSRYVKAFSYNRQAVDEDAIDEGLLLLKVDFSQKLIETLLRNAGYPVWGKVRPSILMLMSLQLNKNIELVSEDSAPELIEYMEGLSVKHGLPTQFPLLDLEDRAVLGYKKPASTSASRVNELGLRYQSDVVLVGDLVGIIGQGWKGVWQSQFSGQVFEWEFQASTKEQVMSKSMSYLAQLLAQEYALGSIKESQNEVIIHVADVTSLPQYLKILRYFASLAVVEKTQVKTLTSDSVSFYLTLRNSPEELHRLIELGSVIEQLDLPVVNATDEQVEEETLRFTYRLL